MAIKFTKMHSLGNDFIIINAIKQKINLTPKKIAQLSNRNTGVGFDQCLLIEQSRNKGIDFFYRIFNANGQEVWQCGNGARCLARYVHHYQLTDKPILCITTHTTKMTLYLNDNQTVTVDMGHPRWKPTDIPVNHKQQAILYPVELKNHAIYHVHTVNVGNPHAVLIVTNIKTAPVHKIGRQISEHSIFPEQTNVGFMQIMNPTHINLRVYERGCGETLACGSGAIAAVAIGRRFHQLANKVTVKLPGGDLLVHWPTLKDSILLTGPATFVYEGQLIS